MDEFETPLQRHYEAQRLSPERTQSILAAGRVVAAKKRRRLLWKLAAAALVIVGVGMGIARSLSPRNSVAGLIEPEDVAAAVVNFFGQTNHELGRVSSDGTALLEWLGTQGAPVSIPLPPALRGLESVGCQVLEVQGQRVSLLCFFLDSKSKAVASGNGSGSRPLVHLLLAPRRAFRTAPRPGDSVRLAPFKRWSFEVWARGDLVLVAATDAPPERLAELLRTL